ncbi:MAG: N-acetylmuramoyl-L-alanine amidase [Ruminococcus sp.]|nr:N-acetylmuramoyl-L-alanine amidase [Ruminococcus sp.]
MKRGYRIFLTSLVAVSVMLSGCEKPSVSVLEVSEEMAKPSVIVDAGHGGADGGGVSVNGVPEKGINLSIALSLADMLTLFGYEVTLTRETDESIHDEGVEGLAEQKLSDMKNRLALFNTPDSVCISIHQNRYTQEQYSGAQMFYYRESAQSGQLAECLRERVCENLQPENERETKAMDDELYLLCNCSNPAVMAECGFISNEAEAELLEDGYYQSQMAFSLMCGLNTFCVDAGRIGAANRAG